MERRQGDRAAAPRHGGAERAVTWAWWGWFLATATVSAIVPGPAVMFVISQALGGGRRRALWGGAGILAVNALYFVLAAVGLGTLLVVSRPVFRVVKWVGAGYLVVLGAKTFAGAGGVALSTAQADDNPDAPQVPGPRLDRRATMRGAVLQLANPKAVLFFTALLPQFVHAGAPVAPQIALLGATSLVAEFIVMFTYATLAGRAAVVAQRPAFRTATNRVSGALLVSVGAGLALARER